MCCCDKIKFIGCFETCSDEITFTGAAEYPILKVSLLDIVQRVVGGVGGGNVTFTLPELMNGYLYTLALEKEDGTEYVDGDGNNCFTIEGITILS